MGLGAWLNQRLLAANPSDLSGLRGTFRARWLVTASFTGPASSAWLTECCSGSFVNRFCPLGFLLVLSQDLLS